MFKQLLASAVIGSSLLAAPFATAADYTLKFGHLANEEHIWNKAAERFKEIIEKRSIVPEVEPRDGDCVIFDGAQLHGVLAERRVHTLLYAGFAANMCVPHRDYGMRAMGKRGYDVVLIEDCTTAIEVADTLEGMALTKAAIVDVAVSVGHTVSSGDLLAAAESARRRG